MNAFSDALLSRKEAAVFCKISERTLDRQTDLPRVNLTERRIMYRQSDLLAWIAGKTAPRAPAVPVNDNRSLPNDAA